MSREIIYVCDHCKKRELGAETYEDQTTCVFVQPPGWFAWDDFAYCSPVCIRASKHGDCIAAFRRSKPAELPPCSNCKGRVDPDEASVRSPDGKLILCFKCCQEACEAANARQARRSEAAKTPWRERYCETCKSKPCEEHLRFSELVTTGLIWCSEHHGSHFPRFDCAGDVEDRSVERAERKMREA